MDATRRDLRIQSLCLLILTTLALAGAMSIFSTVLVPFVLAVFFMYCLAPVIDAQIRCLRLPRILAIVSTIVLAMLLLGTIGLVISGAVAQVTQNTSEYTIMVQTFLTDLADSELLSNIGIDGEALTGTLISKAGELTRATLSGALSGVMSVLSNGVLVLIFLMFLLAGRRGTAAEGSVLWEVESRTKRYLITMLFTSFFTGLLTGLTLAVLGVRFAWMFGFLAFLMNFVPTIGSILATLLPVPVVLLSPELSIVVKVLALCIPVVIQFVIGNIVQPKMMGSSLDLHPVTILLALIFFGMMWGIVGMLLATPITAVLRILLERFEYTRPVAHLLAGNLSALGSRPNSPRASSVTASG